jgi:hypothetical protein
MHQERFSRHLLAAFLLSVVLYATLYWFIEGRRVVHGPWIVSFVTNESAVVEVQVRQESLKLGPVTIRFMAAQPIDSNAWHQVAFDTPKPVPFNVPGGRCVFQDTTFLPGTVVLDLGSTTLQMLPRTLNVGTNEFPWRAGTVIVVDGTSSPRTVE